MDPRSGSNVKSFFEKCVGIVGPENVFSDRARVAPYEKATFCTAQTIPAVVMPATVDELQLVVRAANELKVAIYPVSRGRNWGLGSRAPVESSNCVLDLRRMNRIVDFNEELAYVTVEPGVTFAQVKELLDAKSSNLMLAPIGGPPDASLLANALERGDGVGFAGDRARFSCALEAVLPTGELVQTGLGAFANSLTRNLSPFGLGPAVEGLFFQSNLAIATKLTIWLTRKPSHFQSVVFIARDEAQLEAVTAEVRLLQQRGIVGDAAYSVWNVFRFLSANSTYPFRAKDGGPLTHDDLDRMLPSTWKGMRWIGFVGIYAPNFWIGQMQKRIVKKALRGKAHKLLVVDSILANVLNALKKPITKRTGVDVEKILKALYFESVFLGHPTKLEVSSTYWRKRGELPRTCSPDEHGVGIHWVCPSLPFQGKHIARVTEIVEDIAPRHRLEPMCMFFNMNQWLLKSFIVIMFDRDLPEEEAAAKRCHDEMLAALTAEGYSPVRLGTQSMDMAPDSREYVRLVERLKRTLDPNDILAPGRYDFRYHWDSNTDPQLRLLPRDRAVYGE